MVTCAQTQFIMMLDGLRKRPGGLSLVWASGELVDFSSIRLKDGNWLTNMDLREAKSHPK